MSDEPLILDEFRELEVRLTRTQKGLIVGKMRKSGDAEVRGPDAMREFLAKTRRRAFALPTALWSRVRSYHLFYSDLGRSPYCSVELETERNWT